MKALFSLLCDSLACGRPLAWARVAESRGSAPRRAGALLLADAGGLVAGTVGGGLAEARVLEFCRAALADGLARCADFTLNGELAARSNMICGGSQRVLIEPLLPDAAAREFFCALRDGLDGDEGVALVTDLTEKEPEHSDALVSVFTLRVLKRSAVIGNRVIGAPLPDDVARAARATRADSARPTTMHIGGRDWCLETFAPSFRLILAGGGHVSRPTAEIAALAGFEVTVLDDRPEFATPERFPHARTRVVPDFADCFAGLAPDARTQIVILTRGHLHDAVVLEQALATRAGHIAMIGSRRKREAVYAALRAKGVPEEELARVSCPVGLHIGAETPEEIAVSIAAQCIARRRGIDV